MFRLKTSHLQASTILCQMLLPTLVHNSRKHSVRKTVTKLNPDEIKEENPQCKKRTTTSDVGQCTSNSNTHHNGDKKFQELHPTLLDAIPPNNTKTTCNKIKRKKAPSSNHRQNVSSLPQSIYTYGPKRKNKI